jgi:hypothetical protein
MAASGNKAAQKYVNRCHGDAAMSANKKAPARR